LREGYLTRAKFYDELEKDFLVFDVDSISSSGDKIVLKGSPGDDTFWREHVDEVYCGKLDTDNMHRNYHYSKIQNKRNLGDLVKIAIEVDMRTPNYNLYRYQKIHLLLSNQASTPTAPHINNRMTGDWLIVDIRYTFDGNTYKQTVKLIKRELELAPGETLQADSLGGDNTGGEQAGDNTAFDGTNAAEQGAANAASPDSADFPLTREIYREIYRGKVSERISEKYYEPMVAAMKKHGITSKPQIAAFLSQINAETGHLRFVTELASGEKYEGRADLGNTSAGDGPRYKGRGLIQITGRNNYNKAGKWLGKDFVGRPDSVAADNATHGKGAASAEQIENSILTAMYYWKAGSAWGDLNEIAAKLDASRPLFEGFGTAVESAPNTQDNGRAFGTKKNKNWATSTNKGEQARLFTVICFGVNGGYNGYRERMLNYERARKLLANK
jgi:predicted chitinase